jgi:hypothetical protein
VLNVKCFVVMESNNLDQLVNFDWEMLSLMVVFCILIIGTYWLIMSEGTDCLSFNIMLCLTAVFPSALCSGVVVPGEVGILKFWLRFLKWPTQ